MPFRPRNAGRCDVPAPTGCPRARLPVGRVSPRIARTATATMIVGWLGILVITAPPATAQSPMPSPSSPFSPQSSSSLPTVPQVPSATGPNRKAEIGSEERRNLAVALKSTGSVIFRDTPLSEVILILSEQWKVNIVAGAEVDGAVSGTFRNETLEEILDSLLTANGFHYRQIGNSLVVLSAGDEHARKPTFQVEVIRAPTQSPEDLTELIEALKLQMSPEGQILPIKASSKLAIHDTPERIEAVKRLLKDIVSADVTYTSKTNSVSENASLPFGGSAASGVLELRPQYVMAIDLKETLDLVVPGGVSVVEEENLLVVIGDAAAHQKAQALLRQLDKPRPQVRITGYIYDVDLGELEQLGVDWNQQFMSQAVDANGVPRNLGLSQGGLLTPGAGQNISQVVTGLAEEAAETAAGAAATATTAAPTGGQFLFRTLNSDFELQALIQALEQTEGSRLLADPHVTVVDRHTASLGIVTQVPVQQLTQTEAGGSIGSTSFKDTGITLDVTPRVAADGTIEMEVSPEFSVLSGFQGGNPIIDTRRASTVVRVANGQSLVIGGLRSKTTVETVKGIPGLMNVKWLGTLFRSHNTDVRESEMVVLIMPEIVNFCGGLPRETHALDVTQRQLGRIQTATDGPFTPDCRDKHCPHHRERPKFHNGMTDQGLIGSHDVIFVDPPTFLPSSQPAPGATFPQVEALPPVPTAEPETLGPPPTSNGYQ